MPQTTSKPPAWLFSNHSAPAKDTIVPAQTQRGGVPLKENMAKSSKKDVQGASAIPPPQLMDMVEKFLSDNSFGNAHSAFKKQREKKGWAGEQPQDDAKDSLIQVFETWESAHGDAPAEQTKKGIKKAAKAKPGSSNGAGSTNRQGEATQDVDMKDAGDTSSNPADSGASSPHSDSSSSASSSSDSEDSEDEKKNKKVASSKASKKQSPVTPKTLKRKAPVGSSTSSSDSDSSTDSSSSDSDSSGDDKPQPKKRKTAASSSESSSGSSSDSSSDSSSSDSDSDSEDSDEDMVDKAKEDASSSSDSSDSSSDSDSEAPASKKVTKVTKVTKVVKTAKASKADSDNSSSSDDAQAGGAGLKTKDIEDSSSSSVTLEDAPLATKTSYSNQSPAPGQVKLSKKEKKAQVVPFSRIPKDVKVEVKFASNAYIDTDYSRQAHEALIVTKGKGFTKEKNKKKKGGFRGGYIDINDNKSVYFDD